LTFTPYGPDDERKALAGESILRPRVANKCFCCGERASYGFTCDACAGFVCPDCGDRDVIMCGGERTCEPCHDRHGCPLGDVDGCCVVCERALDCQKLSLAEQRIAKELGMHAVCSMAVSGERA